MPSASHSASASNFVGGGAGAVRCFWAFEDLPAPWFQFGLDRFLWSLCYAHATAPPTRGRPAVLIGWAASGGRLG